ncbi:MFS transporter [Streptomyces collinus]|uniref:Transmembrane efflux protein n=1 Tax=Streptomyces collinus (strain DSM 40733 / Tue 365) TaxID=1214242 RepID=S5UZZ0_STRC3|nr:MFS transporter [Streptomyces collinus]AGS72878.1 transmembrane efflux protein [Streptomyces collinus Tu 365]UJA11541.1 MFS transporter [Streptomyces collinus]UJA13593.1 MFS transporter [Streptomyces collinus]
MNRGLTLASSVAGAVLVALDGTVLTVAQPSLQRSLHASFASVQWTGTAYLVAVASLLVFAGRLGDRYGHRRTFGLGMLGFGAASAGAGLAPGIGWVIGLRLAQGVFGALLQPATLGMLRAAYPPERLAVPLAVRTAAIGLAAAAGPLLGGALVSGPGWRAVFFVGALPAAGFGLAALALPGADRRPAVRTPLDLPGALLLALALACLVQALVSLPGSGVWGVSALGGAVLAGTAFVRHERRGAHPLLPPGVIGSPAVGAALGLLVAASAALFGTLFAETYVLQRRLALDPFQSALRSLPLAVLMVLSAALCPALLRRLGARRTAVAAMALLALGILVLSGATGTAALGGGFALLGAGFGTVMVAATEVVVRGARVAVAGVAGGLQQTALNVGPVLGVAAATALMGAGPRPALLVLAAVAALAVPAARALSGPGAAPDTEITDGRVRSGVPARR